jgi:hypothetical protein
LPAAAERLHADGPRHRWTLSKRDVIKMLMAMDRYNASSVVLKGDREEFNWEIPGPAKRR